MEIVCPRCGRKVKFKDCVHSSKERKRILLDFPCNHYAYLIYNVPSETDINTIVKDFKTIEKEYFNKTYYLHNFGDRILK